VVLLVKRLLEAWCEDDYDYTTWDYVSETLLYVKVVIILSIAVWLGFVPESYVPLALLAIAVSLISLASTIVCAIRRRAGGGGA
jgi:hypothetical protein